MAHCKTLVCARLLLFAHKHPFQPMFRYRYIFDGEIVLFCLFFIYVHGIVLWMLFWLRSLGMARDETRKIGWDQVMKEATSWEETFLNNLF